MRALAVGESRTCITEFEVGYISSKPVAHLFQKKPAVVEYCDGSRSRRVMAKVWIAVKKGQRQMWADVVTGTLFKEDGTCRASPKVRIVEWP